MRKEFVEAKIGKNLMQDAGGWMLQDTGYKMQDVPERL